MAWEGTQRWSVIGRRSSVRRCRCVVVGASLSVRRCGGVVAIAACGLWPSSSFTPSIIGMSTLRRVFGGAAVVTSSRRHSVTVFVSLPDTDHQQPTTNNKQLSSQLAREGRRKVLGWSVVVVGAGHRSSVVVGAGVGRCLCRSSVDSLCRRWSDRLRRSLVGYDIAASRRGGWET